MSIDPASGEELVLLGDEVVDRLSRVCLQLAAELWVTRERLAVLEHQLEAGEPYVALDEADVSEFRRTRPAVRDEFIQRVLGPLLAR